MQAIIHFTFQRLSVTVRRFRVKDIEGYEDPRSSLEMFIDTHLTLYIRHNDITTCYLT